MTRMSPLRRTALLAAVLGVAQTGIPAAGAASAGTPATPATPATGPCAVLPLLSIGYDPPVDLSGRAAGGATRLGITVAPTQNAPATTITTATVEVSVDDGATWTPATLTGSDGRYTAAFTTPTDGFVSTRVTATDAAGNTVTQTVIRAYAIGAPG